MRRDPPPTFPPDSSDAPRPTRVRAVLFDADLDGHEVELSQVDCHALNDQQLLWIDVLLGDGEPPAVVAGCGVEPRHLLPRRSDESGISTTGDGWTFLYPHALNSARRRRFCDEPLTVAIGPNLLLTAHRRPIDFLDAVLDNEAARLRVGSLHVASFAASLLDRMLTDYLDARDEFESAVDKIELLVLRKPRSAQLSELQQLRRQASRLRRYLAVQRDMFDALARPDFAPEQSESVARHWQLLSARYSKVMASVESARDLVNGSFDVYTSRVAHGTNETMRLLTVVTVVLGILAAVGGALGMNFDAGLFDSGDRGFWSVVGGMAVFALGATVAVVWRMVLDRRRG